MEINKRIVGSLEVVKYDHQEIDGDPKIVISMIKVLDNKGEYIKFAKLKNILPYLSDLNIKFNKIK